MSTIDLTEAIGLWLHSVIPPLNRMIRLTVFSVTTFVVLGAVTSQVITTSLGTLNLSPTKTTSTNTRPTYAAQPHLKQSSEFFLNYNQGSPSTRLSHLYLIAPTTSSQLTNRIARIDSPEKEDDSRVYLSQQTSMMTARISGQATTEEKSQNQKSTIAPQLETRGKFQF